MVQKDKATGETTITKVAGGGLQPGSNASTTTVQVDPIKDRIIVLILEQFEEEIAAWLRINGKGSGEEDPDVMLALDLPACFKKDADVLEYIKDNTIPYYKEHPAELRGKIEADNTKKTLFDRIAALFKSKDDVAWLKITDDDQEASRDATCDALSQYVSENFAIEESETGEAIALDAQAPEYILCFTPAGKVYALPKETKLNFTNTTNVPVAKGALTSYYLHDEWYLAHYEKRNGKWYFDGYYKQGGGGRGSSYLTQEQLESKLATQNVNITTASLGAATLILTPEQVLRMPTLNPAAAGQLKNIGRFTVVTLAASVVLELFVSTSSLEYGVGELILELPITFPITEGYVEDIPVSVPITIPISTTDFCPPVGECSVYVIYGQYTSGEYFVAKYGMTCQKDSKPDVNPRPACQIRRLNRALAEKILDPLGTAEGNPEQETQALNLAKNPQVLKYYSARIISGVDKTTALLIEKAMVAAYLETTGSLPPEQGLPNFGAKTKGLIKAIETAVKYLDEFKQAFK